jgi:hypothetical protein
VTLAVLVLVLARPFLAGCGETLHGVREHRELVPGVLAAPAVGHALPAVDTQVRTVALPAGRSLSLAVTVGDVRISGTDGTEAVIEIAREAPSAADLAKIPIELTEEEARIRLRLAQTEGGTDPTLKTHLTVRVPRAAVIDEVRIVEGSLMLSGLSGAIAADVRRGSIEATDVAGTLRLETGIGDIRAVRTRLSPGGLLRLRAFNGDVRLALAARPTDARILALALNGTIASEIPLATKDTWGPRWGEATLGKGEPVISLDVVNGHIEITAPKR